MKLRRASKMSDKVEMQMTPMIDIVFQLLTFFLFSFKIVAPEGDFNIRMPVAGPSASSLDQQLPIKIRLTSDGEGNLTGIQMADRPLANFKELHEQIMGIVGGDSGPDSAADSAEAEIDCDYNLKYRYAIDAVTAISGYATPDGRLVKLIQKIKLSPPQKPE